MIPKIDALCLQRKNGALVLKRSAFFGIYLAALALFWFALFKFQWERLPHASVALSLRAMREGRWFGLWPVLLPAFLTCLSLAKFFSEKQIRIGQTENRILFEKRLFFLPVYRQELALDEVGEIILKNKKSGTDAYRLYLRKKKGGKMLIARTPHKEKIKTCLQALQTVVSIPLVKI